MELIGASTMERDLWSALWAIRLSLNPSLTLPFPPSLLLLPLLSFLIIFQKESSRIANVTRKSTLMSRQNLQESLKILEDP